MQNFKPCGCYGLALLFTLHVSDLVRNHEVKAGQHDTCHPDTVAAGMDLSSDTCQGLMLLTASIKL